jgi:hypothetical protein
MCVMYSIPFLSNLFTKGWNAIARVLVFECYLERF